MCERMGEVVVLGGWVLRKGIGFYMIFIGGLYKSCKFVFFLKFVLERMGE